jgi:hypothetical protein
MGSPRWRITAMIEAAITRIPFSRAFSIEATVDECQTKAK